MTLQNVNILCLIVSYSVLTGINDAHFKKPADGLAVSLFPKLLALLLIHLVALIELGMASKTQCCDAVIVRFQGFALAIP